MKYLDLETLLIKTEEKTIYSLGSNVYFSGKTNITGLSDQARYGVSQLFNNVAGENKVYNFTIHLHKEEGKIDEYDFETMVHLITTEFFEYIITNKGRKRERRLDVPENLKADVHCSLSGLKRAINTATLVNKFNLNIYGGEFDFILVGDR